MHRAPFTADLLVRARIVTTRHPGSVVIDLCGEFDCSTVSELTLRLAEAEVGGPAAIVVDMREVTFLDSATVRAFENTAAAASRRGQGFVLRAPSAIARRVIHLCGASSLIDADETGTSPRVAARDH
jgi:anti-anti-sigma factor